MSLPAFNRVLARHLALALTAGAACDKDLVTRCHRMAGRDAELLLGCADDPLAVEVRLMCIDHDLGVLKHHESRLRKMALPEAESELLRLLNPDQRVAGNTATERLL